MAKNYSFLIQHLDNVENIIENLSIGTHRMRANSMSSKGEKSKLTTLSPEKLDEIQVFAANITYSNVTLNKTITKILEGSTRIIEITADEGYNVPDSVTVVGAIGSYNKSVDLKSAVLSISNPTSNVSCEINGVVEPVINYFYIENLSNNANTIKLTPGGVMANELLDKKSSEKHINDDLWHPNLQYKINNGEWSDYTFIISEESIVGQEIILTNKNDKIYFKGTNNGISDAEQMVYVFNTTEFIKTGGDITTTLDPNGGVLDLSTKNVGAFALLFTEAKIQDASNLILPSTTVNEYGYAYMFLNCSDLVSAPALPATTLAQYCYSNMFSGCANLTSAPALFATTLAEYCCYNMFNGCASLTSAPELPATTLASGCYGSMFSMCTNLTSAPELPATELSRYCYGSMFQGCSALTTAPELPATTLIAGCYSYMFYECTNLNSMSVAFSDWRYDDEPTYNWLYNAASNGTFECPKELPQVSGSSYIPASWSVLHPN